jgi:small-conductance mechanosensitive channel
MVSAIVLRSIHKILYYFHKHFNIAWRHYRTTFMLAKTIVYIATLIAVLLFVPGVDEKIIAFIGIGVGVLVSLSSTSTIGNAVAGLILHVSRPIREGDFVEIDGKLGDVVSIEYLFVHIRTIKDEVVSIPSLMVLNNKIINYSKLDNVIVHVTLTLGYDIDPGLVEGLLTDAAKNTDDVIDEPPAFIIVKSLNDHCVEYELNAYTNKPERLIQVASGLRRNILSEFAKRKVQIMSPTYVNISRLNPQERVIPDRVTERRGNESRNEADDHERKVREAKAKIEEKKNPGETRMQAPSLFLC